MDHATTEMYLGEGLPPADFDAFWDTAMERDCAAPVSCILEPAAFRCPIAQCFHMTFPGAGGDRIHALYLRPAGAGKACHPALLMFHGYTWNAGGFAQKLSYVAMGFSVLAMDCRGQGGATPDRSAASGNSIFGHILRGIEGPPENLYYVRTFLDAAMLVRAAQSLSEVDPKKICTIGDSQGGALALVCAALQPEVRRAVCYYPFLCDYRLAASMPAPTAYDEIPQYFKRADPLHRTREEVFTKLDYIDIRFLAPRIRGKVLWFQGGLDTLCPPQTQLAAYNRLTCEKTLLCYPEYGHEVMPDSHDRAYRFLQAIGDASV